MANIDVISLIFESFALVKAHYREVAVPFIAIILMSGGGYFGGSSFSDLLAPGQDSPSYGNGTQAAGAGLSGSVLLAIVAAIVIMAFVLGTISLSIWYYVCEHFYALLRRSRLKQGWQERMKRHLKRAFVMEVFTWFLVIAAAVLAVAVFVAARPAGTLGAVALAVLVILAALLAFILFMPAWAYYAMDGLPFFASLGRSAGLVRANFVHFLVYIVIFGMLETGAVVASSVTCCFYVLVMPVFTAFIALLSQVTLLKMKLAMEPVPAGKRK